MVSPVHNDEPPVVEAAGLTKVFRDFWGRPKARALAGIDIAVRRGQVFGLLGPNGSGKSTTVKLILGLLYPTRGTLRVLGHRPHEVNVKRHIGYLPEETYLYGYLSAAETLDFFGALFGLPEDERKRRSEQLLEMVGMSHAARRPVGEFSKGMARRIGLAQALINDPELVILDEPTSGLDPIGCREVKDVIRVLAERGKTVLLSSHLLADVEDVCDEVAVLYGGHVRAHGPLGDLLAVSDRTQITTPALDKDALVKVREVLTEYVKSDDVSVSLPQRNLEQFFLDVVRSAREEESETAGVHGGGVVAEYLRESEAEKGERLLRALAGDTESEGTEGEEEGTEEAEESAEEAREAVEERLRGMVESEQSAPAEPEREAHPPGTQQKQNFGQASRRLKSLLSEESGEDADEDSDKNARNTQ